MKKFSLISIPVIVLMLTFSACQKDEAADTDTSFSEDLVLVTQHFNDVGDISDDAFFGDLNLREGEQLFIPGPCATKTLDTTITPHLLTIDFGPTNCLCNDGRYRRGEILVTWTGHYRDSGTVITQTTNNYYVNDNKIDLTRTVTNMGHNTNGNLWFTIAANGTVIKALSGDTIVHQANRQREWIAGVNTPIRMDDVYLITGNSSISGPAGTGTSVINTALRRELSCKWFVSGSVTITPPNKPARLLDYGNGNCDKFATVTINGVTYNIIIH